MTIEALPFFVALVLCVGIMIGDFMAEEKRSD